MLKVAEKKDAVKKLGACGRFLRFMTMMQTARPPFCAKARGVRTLKSWVIIIISVPRVEAGEMG